MFPKPYYPVSLILILFACLPLEAEAYDSPRRDKVEYLPFFYQAPGQEVEQESNTHTISGFVVDAESSENLIGAAVYAPEFSIGTTTNRYGFFSLTVNADSVSLLVSHIGYAPVTVNQKLTEDVQLTIELLSVTTRLDDVEVVAVGESIVESVQMGEVNLPVATIRALPVLAGEVDVLKTLQLLPGVQSGREGTSGLYVRGGAPDQNLILLDGVTVYNASHLFGFMSVFNGDAIKDVTLIKGGFPARYGGRLSSVVDLSMQEGNLQEFEGTAAVGVVASSFTVQGPIRKDKASFIVAARRTYLDLLVYPFLDEDARGGYYFYDVSAKINYIASGKDRLYLSFYTGRDRGYTQDRFDLNDSKDEYSEGDLGWRNMTATARWNRVYGSRFFSNTLLGLTRYRLGTDREVIQQPVNDRSTTLFFKESNFTSGITDVIGRIDFDFIPNPQHYIRFGLGGIMHAYHTGTFEERQSGENIMPVDTVYAPDYLTRSVEAHAYVEDELRLSSVLTMNVGLRASTFLVEDRAYSSLQPRFSARWIMAANLAMKVSYASMQQYTHLLSAASGLSLPLDLWVPATDQVRPQSAHQVATGFAWNTEKRQYEVSLEGYYKRMNSLIEYKEGVSRYGISGDSWEERITTGKGWSYGGEVFVRRHFGRITGWVGYSLTKSERKFSELNGGETFPYRFDRLHDVSIVASYHWTDAIEISAVWVYGTGQSTWLPVGRFYGVVHDAGGGQGLFSRNRAEVPSVYGERNSYRVRAHHRIDLSMHLKRNIRWGYRTLSFGGYNAYNRKNPFLLEVRKNWQNDELLEFRQISAFPVIPFVTYRIEF